MRKEKKTGKVQGDLEHSSEDETLTQTSSLTMLIRFISA